VITSNDSEFHVRISFAIPDQRAENGGQPSRDKESERNDEIGVGQKTSRDLVQQKRETRG